MQCGAFLPKVDWSQKRGAAEQSWYTNAEEDGIPDFPEDVIPDFPDEMPELYGYDTQPPETEAAVTGDASDDAAAAAAAEDFATAEDDSQKPSEGLEEFRRMVNEGIIEEEPKQEYAARVVPPPAGKIRCPNCWRDNPKSNTECEYCGKLLRRAAKQRSSEAADYGMFKELRDSTITCDGCGARVSWGALTCDRCGMNPRGSAKAETEEDFLFHHPLVYLVKKAITSAIKEGERASSEKQRIAQSRYRNGANNAMRGTVRCRSCWNDNPPGSLTCEKCGARLNATWASKPKAVVAKAPQRLVCNCGYRNLPGVTVCLKCGGSIDTGAGKDPNERKYCTCGYKNLPKVTICLKCKGIVREEARRKCRECGFENDMDVTTCVRCHAKLAPIRK